MEKHITGNEVVKDMEYLITLLHKEWERSGKAMAEAIITLEEAEPIYRKFAGEIVKRETELNEEKMTFERSMELSKENYILLRLVKKIKEEEEKTNEKGMDVEFSVELDLDERRIFRSIILLKAE